MAITASGGASSPVQWALDMLVEPYGAPVGASRGSVAVVVVPSFEIVAPVALASAGHERVAQRAHERPRMFRRHLGARSQPRPPKKEAKALKTKNHKKLKNFPQPAKSRV